MHSNRVTVNGKYWTIKTHSYTMIYWRCETNCSLRNNSACPLGSSSLINQQHFRHYTLSTFIYLILSQSLSCPCCVFVFLSLPKTQKRSQSLSKYALLFEPEAFAQLASVHLYTINLFIPLILYFTGPLLRRSQMARKWILM